MQLSYAIGVAEPLSIYVDTYGTGKKTDEELVAIIRKNWDLRPGVIGALHTTHRPARMLRFGMQSVNWTSKNRSTLRRRLTATSATPSTTGRSPSSSNSEYCLISFSSPSLFFASTAFVEVHPSLRILTYLLLVASSTFLVVLHFTI